MTDVKGFFYPRTASGRSSLIPSPPWYYSGDLLTVEYRTDPARVAELLPLRCHWRRRTLARLPLSGRTGSRARLSRRTAGSGTRNTRKHSSSSAAVSRARHSRAVSTSGWTRTSRSAGASTRAIRRSWVHVADPAASFSHGAPQIGPGGVFGATLAAGDRRLAEAVLTLREQSETNGFVNSHKMAHHRIVPGIASGAPDAYAELIESGSSDFEAGPAWTGDVELRLFDSPTEELSSLSVDEIIGGYYRQVGVVWNGGGR